MSNIITTQSNGFAPATIDEAMRLADTLSRSSMVPRAYQGKPEDILVATIWGKEIGLATLQALQNIAVINGKPSVYGDAAMALVQASPVCEDVQEYFENEGTPNPVAVCVAKRKNRKEVVAKFSVEDAKRAGLWGKQGPWSAYPKRMMQMRARGFALRDAFPDVLKGLITAEEAQDYPDEAKPRQVKDITPSNPLDMIAPPEQPSLTVDEIVEEMVLEETELVDIPELSSEEPAVEVQPAGEFALKVPGREEAYSTHNTLEEWADAYEEMADKTTRAGKLLPRDRMTKLRELKEANETTLKSIDTVKRSRHTANYQKRLKALGAAQ